ncbi:transferase [Umbelopsis sp. AD052]|nr:transferase [Umbelopsis sp. AD052]
MTVQTYTIYPTKKHNRQPPPSSIVLHGLDLLSSPIQIQNHRFYYPASGAFSDIINNLKASLAEALELYPPVTGTVIDNEKGETCIAVDPEHILGTPFLVDTKDTPYTGDAEDLSPRTEVLLAPLSSILAVKVTQFSCGTIAVASSFNHQAADLRGFLDFLELWALLARGESPDFTEIPVDWSRTPGQYFPRVINQAPEETYPSPPPFSVSPTPVTSAAAYLLVPSVFSRWKFTKSSLEQMKNDFSPSVSSDQSGLWISSGDALAAIVSGVITRARTIGKVSRLEGRSSEESQIEKVAMAADGRERAVQAKMSGGHYFGNFNNLWSAEISRSDLLSSTPEAASRIALAIRSGINVHLSPEAIARRIAFFDDPENTQPPGRIVWAADIILTNWCRFDLQGPKFDVGWGKPFSATPGGGTVFPPGYCLMMQDNESGDVTALITVEHDGEDVLKADALLNKYATLQAAL